MTRTATRPPVGALLRDWRVRRRLSQLELSNETGVSTRHLSFLETGRARPSRSMVLHLADRLDVPLRARNQLLLAAGYAPAYGERPLEHPDMGTLRAALDAVLAGYDPFPAVVVDRRWDLVTGNRAADQLLAGADPALLAPPVNVLRLSLSPAGLAPRIANLAQWRTHVLHRLAREARLSGDPALTALHDELAPLPCGLDPAPPDAIAVPLRLRTDAGELAILSTVTTFRTAVDVTAAELTVEAFLPADDATRRALAGSG